MVERRLAYPGTPGLILRRTYPELEKSHILKLFEEYPSLRPYYNDQKKRIMFRNGSVLFFGSAPFEKDMGDFYSAEFADIMVDEAQEFTQGELEKLSGSNRCTSNPDITPKMVYTFMPGRSESGVPPRGLPYLKRVFIDGVYRDEEKRHCGPDGRWAFVQAFSWDNIEWARKELTRDGIGKGTHQSGDPRCDCQECIFYSWPEPKRREYFIARTEYGANLASLTDKDLREAWLFGKWDVFEGQYFPRFDAKVGGRHVLPRAQIEALLKPWYTYWISGDWGYDHPHCIHLHAKDEHSRVITFKELWGRKVGETELGQRIGAICAGKKFKCFPFSWDAFGTLNKTTKKAITEMIGKGMPAGMPKPTPADKSAGSRVSGARLMSQVIDSDHWLISEDCQHLIETLPTLVRDPENTEDVLKVDYSENGIGDDAYDSARMGLQHELGTFKPGKVKVEEALQGVRQQFAAQPSAPSPLPPGVDPFAKFGGKKF